MRDTSITFASVSMFEKELHHFQQLPEEERLRVIEEMNAEIVRLTLHVDGETPFD